MDNKFARKTIKERLILSGIDEIGNCGVAGFSLRQVAVSCNVSCATPYNYFKNKEGFVVEIIQYIKHQWMLLKTEINKLQSSFDEIAAKYVTTMSTSAETIAQSTSNIESTLSRG